MYKNIIWDFDGTLFDSYPAIAEAFLAALRDHGRSGDLLEIRTLAQVSLNHCLRTLSSAHDLSANVIEEAFRKNYQQSDHLAQSPFPGARQVCQYICRIGGSNVIVAPPGDRGYGWSVASTPYGSSVSRLVDGRRRPPEKAGSGGLRSGDSRVPTGALKDPGNWR